MIRKKLSFTINKNELRLTSFFELNRYKKVYFIQEANDYAIRIKV